MLSRHDETGHLILAPAALADGSESTCPPDAPFPTANCFAFFEDIVKAFSCFRYPGQRICVHLLASALLVLPGACVDAVPSTPTTTAPTETFLSLAQAAGEPGPDIAIEPRFELELDVNGAFKPGHPLHFTVRGSARFATQDAEVRLILPEVAAAERSSWELIEVPVGEAIPPHLRMRKGFAGGESFRERATVTIPEPGYYFVLANVIQRSDDPRVSEDGHVIGTGASREMWLWIDEHGGRVTEHFDPAVFPEGTRKVRGPIGSERRPPRLRDGRVVITCSVSLTSVDFTVSSYGCPPPPDTSLSIGPPPPPPSATAAVTVTYSDANSGSSRPLADAWVAWKVFSTINGAQVNSGAGYTSASGASSTIDCKGPTTERRLEVTIHTENRKAQVKSYITSNPDRTQVGQYFGSCGGSIPIAAANQQAHLFMNMSKNYDGHALKFGMSPPTLMRAGLYPTSSYGTRYDWGDDHIRVETASWDHIWGEQGVMVAAHEWGHLWQDQYLFQHPAPNGLRRFYQLTCPNPHPVGERTNMACALGEAFADWYGVVVREGDLPGWRRELEENRMHLFHCGSRCTDDGSIVQGAVSAFLWDITDSGTGESHDAVQKSPLAVVDAIKTCEVKHSGSDWYAYNGIDHLIRCMERRSPYQVRLAKTYGSGDTVQTFFNTREQRYWTVDQRGYTVDNLSDAFRKLWLVNLYSRRVNVGSGPILRNIEEEPAPELPQPTPCGMERMCYEPY